MFHVKHGDSMNLNDTIAAISTPPGEGGIGIVRISGPKAFQIAEKMYKSKKKSISSIVNKEIAYGHIYNPINDEQIDEVLLSKMAAPHTYTAEDVVEINCHGGAMALYKTLEITIMNGARLAEPGEFTQRAFLNGRIDLAQAEAVIDVIRSKSDSSLKIAINQLEGGLSSSIDKIRNDLLIVEANIEATVDFSDEDIETLNRDRLTFQLNEASKKLLALLESFKVGKIIREGLRTAIIGRPNVGKSSILNALLKEKRAIVTSIPGTTRDIIEEILNIGGIPLKIRDTAGLRKPKDEIEKIGIELTEKSLHEADLVLLVIDSSESLNKEDRDIIRKLTGEKTIVVYNKIDLPKKADLDYINNNLSHKEIVQISATERIGIDKLEEAIKDLVFSGQTFSLDETIITNVRHKEAISQALKLINESTECLGEKMPEEIIAGILREAIEILGRIIGKSFNQDLLDTIFSQFCLGK